MQDKRVVNICQRGTMYRYLIILFLATIVGAIAISSPAMATSERISPGETITGRLQSSDDYFQDDDCYYDSYIIEAETGSMLRITQSSERIDCYLLVLGPDGRQSENDDYEADSFDSQVTVHIIERGTYEILCSSYSPETGPYDLSIEELSPPRYFGIFVGIEDYGEEWDEAPYCDRDAESVFAAFVDTGLMDPTDGIVLTNRRADNDNVRDAFDEIADVITSEDYFVFFFSGHGDRVEATGRGRNDEMDGMDEAIALYDDNLLDNTLAEYLENLDNALSVVVIDSCHAGGMARDVVNRPGVVCFASSEEDVLSDFAPELQAGGYLSAFFRDAIAGHGDLDNDYVLMMGELTHYLVSEINAAWPSPEMATYGYQELVHERGLVPQNAILCWWDPGTIRPGGRK